MKNKKLIIVIFIILVSITPILHIKADSGFGGSYGGGSSHGGGIFIPTNKNELFIFILIVVAILAVFIAEYIADLQTQKAILKKTPQYDPEKFKQFLPDFDENNFKNNVFDIYKKIQIAWMNFDYDSIRKHVTNEMYNKYKSQLTILKTKKQTEVINDINLININIIGMDHKDNINSLIVIMKVECYDYITDKNNKIVKGTNKRKIIYEYALAFNKGISKKDNKCPNCKAPLENVNSSKCPYCDSVIISKNCDWILAKKIVLSQRYKDEK